MTRNVIKVRSKLIWCHLTKRLPITGSSIAERSVGVLSDSSQKRPKCGNMLLSLYCQCWTHSFPQDSTGKAVVAFHVISHGMSQSQKGQEFWTDYNHLRPFFFLLYDSVWFSLIWFSLMMSHVIHKLVTCLDIVLKGPEGPEAHQWKLLLSRTPCRTSLRFVLDQDSEMHVWVALLVFCSWFCKLLSMCCSCSNIIFTSKSPPSGKSQKV